MALTHAFMDYLKYVHVHCPSLISYNTSFSNFWLLRPGLAVQVGRGNSATVPNPDCIVAVDIN